MKVKIKLIKIKHRAFVHFCEFDIIKTMKKCYLRAKSRHSRRRKRGIYEKNIIVFYVVIYGWLGSIK